MSAKLDLVPDRMPPGHLGKPRFEGVEARRDPVPVPGGSGARVSAKIRAELPEL